MFEFLLQLLHNKKTILVIVVVVVALVGVKKVKDWSDKAPYPPPDTDMTDQQAEDYYLNKLGGEPIGSQTNEAAKVDHD